METGFFPCHRLRRKAEAPESRIYQQPVLRGQRGLPTSATKASAPCGSDPARGSKPLTGRDGDPGTNWDVHAVSVRGSLFLSLPSPGHTRPLPAPRRREPEAGESEARLESPPQPQPPRRLARRTWALGRPEVPLILQGRARSFPSGRQIGMAAFDPICYQPRHLFSIL